ncbi:ankyrin repeat and SAM domain-containing protein 1A-like protein [Cinnamomum micranthum f. kanehirae]|uniref:Ankyrin repeat and SAM domain-containing protein 1A-like protein n=1 Tax=Cinnamomum micranthum f. kanehirae TaxID=337451 RepID=A0A443NAU8_9MAGN|nr:ankyrin repeat and SAM domain-containing protein 1A-like protein [Cinnamomum micranthum f. kanehirae]
MSSNPSPPPPPPPTTTSQSDSKTQISHEISLENPPPTTPQVIDQLFQKTKDELFQKAMQEDWDAVVSIYEEKGDIVSTAKITRNKETALHIAISDRKTKVVKKLLDIIHHIKIREMMNDMDENLLHLAASLGQAETCKQLVEKDPELIGARNKEGETPLFKAALHGKERAFYALHPKVNELMNMSCFLYSVVSPTFLCLSTREHTNRISCTGLIVDLDEVETPSHFRDEHCSDFDFPVPRNYQTCLDLLKLWKYICTAIARWARKWKDIKHDIRKIFNKDVEKQLPVSSTDKDKKLQAPEEPSQDKKCEHSHIIIKVGDEIKKKGEGSQEKEKDSKKLHPTDYNVRAGKDKKQAPEEPSQDLIAGDSSKHCEQSHTNIEGKDKKQAPDEPSQDKIAGDPSKHCEHSLINIEGETHDGVSHIPPQQECGRPKGSELEKACNLFLLGDHRNMSPVLIAVKMGVKEMVEEILNEFPVAIRDEDADKKNVVLLAVENRHPKIYKLLWKK